MNKKYNVFISHKGVDDDSVQRLKERLIFKGYYIRNGSIDSTKHRDEIPPKKVIERLLQMRINWAGTFICLIGENTHKSKWVNYEIEQAHLKGKRIVGIYAHGCKENVELPEKYKEYGGPALGWNSLDKLGAVLDGENVPTEKPDGSISTPIFTITRVKC
ncbi:TIR domain-containing protein [Flavobacterium sp. XS2P24]|uniref:TIR domain-containing protein n=1 Tax=Flavobacterium sp. XS2P24 TaxID=3041249 RepID=UPI0024A8C235|nr:TIR domain-containing protein [Flavobacterium sp. XS2P24]MDI6050578.1 TIR domain-containing protein [Flavobacterium sp. XS2P24]